MRARKISYGSNSVLGERVSRTCDRVDVIVSFELLRAHGRPPKHKFTLKSTGFISEGELILVVTEFGPWLVRFGVGTELPWHSSFIASSGLLAILS